MLAIQKKVLGPEHPVTLRSMNNLANAIGEQARDAEAEQLHREVLAIQKRCWAPSIPTRSRACTTWPQRLTVRAAHAEAETAQPRGAGDPEACAGPRASRHARRT